MKAENLPFRSDWLSKSLAGLILGFILGVGISGLFMAVASDMLGSIKAQLSMWIITPVWLSVLTSVYWFQNGLRAWLWLTLINITVFGLFFILHAI